MGKQNEFHQDLYRYLDTYVHCIYRITKKFPKEEMFTSSSQLRRSALSVMLNYIEGYGRIGRASYKNFLTIAYGSLKESRYLVQFAFDEEYISEKEKEEALKLADTIGKMLWGVIKKL